MYMTWRRRRQRHQQEHEQQQANESTEQIGRIDEQAVRYFISAHSFSSAESIVLLLLLFCFSYFFSVRVFLIPFHFWFDYYCCCFCYCYSHLAGFFFQSVARHSRFYFTIQYKDRCIYSEIYSITPICCVRQYIWPYKCKHMYIELTIRKHVLHTTNSKANIWILFICVCVRVYMLPLIHAEIKQKLMLRHHIQSYTSTYTDTQVKKDRERVDFFLHGVATVKSNKFSANGNAINRRWGCAVER